MSDEEKFSDLPSHIQICIIILLFITSLSELLPYVRHTEGNGVAHALELIGRRSFKNLFEETKQ